MTKAPHREITPQLQVLPSTTSQQQQPQETKSTKKFQKQNELRQSDALSEQVMRGKAPQLELINLD